MTLVNESFLCQLCKIISKIITKVFYGCFFFFIRLPMIIGTPVIRSQTLPTLLLKTPVLFSKILVR